MSPTLPRQPRGVCVNVYVFFLTPGPLRPGFNALGRADYLSVHNSSYYYVTENKAFSKTIFMLHALNLKLNNLSRVHFLKTLLLAF